MALFYILFGVSLWAVMCDGLAPLYAQDAQNYRFIALPQEQCNELGKLILKTSSPVRYLPGGSLDVKDVSAKEQFDSLIKCSVEGILIHREQLKELEHWRLRQRNLDPELESFLFLLNKRFEGTASAEEQFLFPLMRLREILLYQPYRGQSAESVYRMMTLHWNDVPAFASKYMAAWLTHPKATLDVSGIFLRPKALKQVSLVAVGLQVVAFFFILFGFKHSSFFKRFFFKTLIYIFFQGALLVYVYAVFKEELKSTKDLLLSDGSTTQHHIPKSTRAQA